MAATPCRCAPRPTPSLFEPRDLVAEGPQGWMPDHLPAGAKLGLRPLAHHRQWRGGPAPGGGEGGRHLGRLRHQSASTRSGPTGLPRPKAQAVPHALQSGGRRQRRQARPRRREPEESQGRRGGDHPVRFRLLAVQYPRAATCRTRLSCWPSPSCMPTAAPICSWTKRSAAPDLIAHLGDGVRLQAADGISPPRWMRLKGKTVLADPATAAAAIFDRLDKAGAKVKPRRRSLPIAQGLQEPAGDRRHAQGPYPRRRGAVALPLLVRARGAQRRLDRNRRRRGAGRLPPRHQLSLRPVVRFHFRRGRQWRHRALPGHALDQPRRSPTTRCS